MNALLVVALTAAVVGVSACGSDGSSNTGASDAPAKTVSKADVPKGAWPLTVDKGTVNCEGTEGAGVVTFEAPDGTVYAVNGTAKTQQPDLPEIEEIWRKDPDVPGARINLSPVIDKGLELCK